MARRKRHSRRRSLGSCDSLGCVAGFAGYYAKRNMQYIKWGAAAVAAWWLYRKTKSAAEAAAAAAAQSIQNSADQADAVGRSW